MTSDNSGNTTRPTIYVMFGFGIVHLFPPIAVVILHQIIDTSTTFDDSDTCAHRSPQNRPHDRQLPRGNLVILFYL